MNRINLITEGNEFTLPNGNLYTGYYHIHSSKGAMVGPSHVESDHELLTPVNETVEETVASIQTELATGEQRQRNLIVNLNNQPVSSPPSVSGGGGGGGGY